MCATVSAGIRLVYKVRNQGTQLIHDYIGWPEIIYETLTMLLAIHLKNPMYYLSKISIM